MECFRQCHADKPRVLAVTGDSFALRGIRLEMPLSNLKRQGLIEDYLITDELLSDLPDEYCFDVVWLQRVCSDTLIDHLAHTIDSKYLYDIDDLLIGNPSYTKVTYGANPAVSKALRGCAAITVTSQRLLRLLEEYSKLPLRDRAVVCPNGFEFSESLRRPEVPKGLILTSSDHAALLDSRYPVTNAIAEFSKKNELPIYCFGYVDNDMKSRLSGMVDLGTVSFWHHKALLASFPSLIGVAPLETICPKEDMDFINAKSDLKMVEFGGFGHPSVFSSAPPFMDTDLKCGVLVENEEKAWFDALELVYRERWRRLDSEQAEIIRRRHMNKIAAECWHEAISNARLKKPLFGKEIKLPFSKQPEVELAEVLNSRSWKITAPLRYGYTLLQRALK